MSTILHGGIICPIEVVAGLAALTKAGLCWRWYSTPIRAWWKRIKATP